MSVTIRPLRREDESRWRELWAGYLAFYRTDLDEALNALVFERLLDPAEPMHALLAERDGEIIGLVHYVFHRATWTATSYCYLEDLFTDPAARGAGAGRALILAVYEAARSAGASRVYWLTEESNATARALYDKVADNAGFIQYRKAL